MAKPVVYEYKIVILPLPADDNDTTAKMNELGADGWQLITTTITEESRLWFMREVKSNQPNEGVDPMAEVPVTIHCLVYPKNKTVQPFPATIVGVASLTDLGVGGGPIEPPDIKPPPDWDIWPKPGDPDFPIDILPDPPPDETPPAVTPPHLGWNWSVVKSCWYYLYVPGEGSASPKGRR